MTKPEMLDEAGILDRLHYVSKILRTPESALLEAMDQAREEDEDLDYLYALYHVVFKRLRVPKNRAYHVLKYKDDDTLIFVVVARKGAFAPNPEDRVPLYHRQKMPHIKVRQGQKFQLYLHGPYIPATKQNRVVTLRLERIR